ncbi:MAG TPA: hypothetical protein VHE80_08310, partial [Acidimicrobiales bacterium]|nr:hypothetical protein [Acidimicrobiales bacterium]
LPGLELVAETPAPTAARGAAGVGLSAGVLRATVGGRTRTESSGGQVTAAASCEVPALDLGDVSVRGLRSMVEIVARPDGPPLVSYALTIAELRLGGRRVLGVDGGPVSVRVGPVPIMDLAGQLRRQPGLSGIDSPPGLDAHLRLLEPRVDTSDPETVSITAPVVEVAATGIPGIAGPLSARLATAAVSTGPLPGPEAEDGGEPSTGPSGVRRGVPSGGVPSAAGLPVRAPLDPIACC